MSFSHAFKLALPIVLSLGTSALFAQSFSVDDLKAKIDAEMNKGNEYAELLNDPDPTRAQTAMKMMLESGDEELVQIALEYGLYSPDKVVRNEAIKAFLDSSPRLELQFDGKKADQEKLEYVMGRVYSLVPNGEGYAVTTIDITGFQEAENCYVVEQFYRGCFLRIVGENIQYRSSDAKWYEMEYLDHGALTAVVTQYANKAVDVRITIPLR